MNRVRKVFLAVGALLFVGTIAGVTAMTVMEYQARGELPLSEQNVHVIATVYDGAVCLTCDIYRYLIAIAGAVCLIITLSFWGMYEAGRFILNDKNSLS